MTNIATFLKGNFIFLCIFLYAHGTDANVTDANGKDANGKDLLNYFFSHLCYMVQFYLTIFILAHGTDLQTIITFMISQLQ